MKRRKSFRTLILAAAVVAAVLLFISFGGTYAVGLPFEGDSERLKYVLTTESAQTITLAVGNRRETFAIASRAQECPHLRGVTRWDAREQRELLDLIARRQGYGQGVAFGIVFSDTLYRIERFLGAEIEREAVDADITLKDGTWLYRTERDGVRVDRETLYQELYNAFMAERVAVVESIRVAPRVRKPELMRKIGKRYAYTTSIATSSPARKHNVRLALERFRDRKILPGETVSFLDMVGPRTEAAGFKVAKIILGGKYEDGLGGGICQASTTLYNALLLGGVHIDRVASHSLPPSYVEPSFDAMVNAGTSDLVFTNHTKYPIFIAVKTSDTAVTAAVYGEKLSVRYEKHSVIDKRTPPPAPEIVADTDGAYRNLVTYEDERALLNVPHDAIESRGYLLTYAADGKLIDKKQIRRDKYNYVRAKMVKGTKKRPNLTDQDVTDSAQCAASESHEAG